MPDPKRGEIWWVDFNPTQGSEIRKKRPAVVISSDSQGALPLRLVAPITEWKKQFSKNIWHVKIDPNNNNGLTKLSAVDVMQVRSADIIRFKSKWGKASSQIVEEIVTALAIVIEYQ